MPSLHGPASPTATSLIERFSARSAAANSLCFRTYSSSDMCPSCQLPYISLPMPHHFTWYGSACPFLARHAPIGVSAAPLAYCNSSTALVDVAQAAVERDVGFGAENPAEGHELVQPEVIVFDAGPGRVLARRTAVAVADAIFPVVAADEVAARPAIDRRIQLLQHLQRVGPHALDIVGGHQRDGAHVARMLVDCDGQRRVVCGLRGQELERVLGVLVSRRTESSRLLRHP